MIQKNALGGFVGFATHYVGDETIGGSNAVLLFTMSEDLGTMDVPSGQIGPCALPEILVLDAHGSVGGYGQSGLFTASRLDASFFIRGEDELRAL
jgi:hypothetical protein